MGIRNAFVVLCACLSATLGPADIALADPPQGAIVAWGCGGFSNFGQCDVPTPNTGFVAVAAGGIHSLGLKADGSIVAWGRNYEGQTNVPAPNTGFIAVAGGWYHSVGLKTDGSIVAWGCEYSDGNGQDGFPSLERDPVAPDDHSHDYGQCNVPVNNSEFIAVAAGAFHNLGLRADGSIVAWGDNEFGQTNVPEPNADFIAVAGGVAHSLALKADGSIAAWGCRDSYNRGQCDVPAPNSGFTAVSVGYLHSVALKGDKSIVAWGYNQDHTNVPAPNADFIGIAGGGYHNLALKTNGTIVAWGDDKFGESKVPTPNSGFIAMAAGEAHSLAIRGGFGACCDLLSGGCTDDVPAIACSGTHQAWSEDATCADVECAPITGACCDLVSGMCAEHLNSSACSGTQQAWTGGATCLDVECGAVAGACCDHDPFGACTNGVTQAACDCPTCDWVKLGSCSELDCPHTTIPTVSEWGLVVLTLLLLTGAKLAFRHREVRFLTRS